MTTKLETLRDCLRKEVKDLYSAELQLLKALPKLAKKASSPKLKEAFREHLVETEDQIVRLDAIGKLLQEKLSGKTCKAMQGLIEEGNEIIEEVSDNKALLDTLLVGAAKRVEHYEIAAYSCAYAIAEELGLDDIADLLEDSLKEEEKADKRLSSIAKKELLSLANVDSANDDEAHSSKQTSDSHKKIGNAARVLGMALSLALTPIVGSVAFAETDGSKVVSEAANNEAEAANYEADNSGSNLRDKNELRVTPDNQSMGGGTDLALLSQIRREIVANDNLSTNAHNVKIVVAQGNVTLRGPVASAEEKNWIQKTAVRLANGFKVNNQLEITAE